MISKKNLKPIEYDLHLKYLCPNPSCCSPHWLSLKEAQIKGFKIVCVCGTVFSVKTVEKFRIKFTSKNKKKQSTDCSSTSSHIDKAIALLKTYGFNHAEASDMIEKCVSESPNITDHVTLVKHSLFLVKND